jgi:hypothetical protein
MTDVQYAQKRWDLGDLFPGLGSAEIGDSLEELDEQVGEFETYRSKLSEDMDEKLLLEILQAPLRGLVRPVPQQVQLVIQCFFELIDHIAWM